MPLQMGRSATHFYFVGYIYETSNYVIPAKAGIQECMI